MRRMRRNKKAVSPVIAALLLIAIAVAAAVVTYSWVMSMIRSSGGQAQTAIRVDEVLFAQNKKGSTTELAGAVVDESLSTITRIYLTSVSNFAVGDYVKIGTVYTDVTAIGATYIDVTALAAEPADGATVVEQSINAMKISIRNTGSVPATIQTIYLYKGDTQMLKADKIGVAIGAGVLTEFGIKDTSGNWAQMKPSMGTEPTGVNILSTTFASDLVVASGYSVKVVTDTGFTVEGTYYTPSDFA